MNAQEIINTALGLEQETIDEFYTSTELWLWLNLGLLELCEKGWCYQKDFTITSVKDQAEYDYPAGLIVPLRVYYSGEKLKCASVSRLDSQFPTWMSDDAGTPAYYYEPETNVLGFYNKPDTAGLTITVKGLSEHATVSSVATTLYVPKVTHEALVDYLQYRMAKKDKRPADAQASYSVFLAKCREAKKEAMKLNRTDRRFSIFPSNIIR